MQIRPILITVMLLGGASLLSVQAQDAAKPENNKKADNKKADVPPPPPLPPDVDGNFQEKDEFKADVTIRRGKHKVIEEYRVNGQLYMVRVIPEKGKAYYIRYPQGVHGPVIRKELDDIQTPFWKLFEW